MLALTLYGIPQSVAESVRSFFAGSVGDVLWKALVTVLLLAVGYLLLAMGSVGAVIGGILVGTLFSDDVRAAVRNVWNREWANVDLPF